MKYNQLGKSPIQVSEISFGCMSLGAGHTANAALLHQALDAGITLFDTADLYDKGENEVTVGKAFRGRRQEVILASKVGNQWRPDGSGWDWNPSKAYILQAVEHSLRRLQTDYLDLYQLHGGTLEDPIDETIEAFELLREQGKIREYGISSIRPNVIREYVRKSNIASVMMQYNLLDRRPEEASLNLLGEHQISVLARGSYAQGLLAGKPAKAYLSYSAEEVQRAAQAVQQVAERVGSTAQVAVGLVLEQPVIASAVLGIRTDQQLHEAIRAGQRQPLTPAELETLRQAIPDNRYEQHR
ncbi:aldo/keto reductase [Hymenobacter cellulosilyticus]|uniref:Aldo/keto reductase n=1 Tax=Hymenobacter cellulosilyticus TaxID=2932248 RepID=A0A8T9Q5P0_9BACT|nr:aldo/keto reductase [Hymenobacter cellulosilyticus]UOQ70779.1 aldo/keto reductase [Hymenobacter cellulosilyticus]